MTTAVAKHPVYDFDAKPPKDVHKVRAHEIWGGNDAATEHLLTPGFEAWLYSRPLQGHASGGDLRYASTCAAGQIVRFTLADLAGHGEEASGFALQLRALMRKHMNTPNPTSFARALNGELSRLSQQGRFATAVIQTYFAPTDHLIICNAGHPRPLIYRAASGAWELFDDKSPALVDSAHAKETGIANLPLGVLGPTAYPQFATHLEAGDIVISYTDALIEATSPAGEQLGESGLLKLVRSLDAARPAQLGPAILDAASRWRAGKPPEDDETLLVLHHNASDPPDGAWARVKALGRLVGIVK